MASFHGSGAKRGYALPRPDPLKRTSASREFTLSLAFRISTRQIPAVPLQRPDQRDALQSSGLCIRIRGLLHARGPT